VEWRLGSALRAAPATQSPKLKEFTTMTRTRRVVALTITVFLSSLFSAGAVSLGADDVGSSAGLPTEFSGRLGCGTPFERTDGRELPSRSDETDEEGIERSFVNAIWQFPVLEMSDPRLDGRFLGYQNGVDFRFEGDEIGIFSGLWHVTNEGGEWVGAHTFARLSPTEYSTQTVRLSGKGSYEGLTAVIQTEWRADCGYDLRGFVVDSPLPDYPTPVTQ
jgi:hypothetical protein